MRVGIGLGITRRQGGDPIAALFRPAGRTGWRYPLTLGTVFQDVAGTIPVTEPGQPVRRKLSDLTGNHATQSVSLNAPTWQLDDDGLPYLAYNGSNSSMATASFAWGSDKATVCVGVRKNSDAGGFGVVLGFGNALNGTTPGEFAVVAPDATGQPNYAFRSIGTSQGAAVATGFAAPITSVVTGIGDISGDRATIRVNGAQVAQNSTNQGDGNYGTQQLFWGGRNGNSLFFNGREYPSIGINAALTASELAMVEAWVTARTGALG